MRRTPTFEDVHYANPRRPGLDVEVLGLSELFLRADHEHFRAPQRPQFHLLFLVTAGDGEHLIDFRRHRCLPGTVLHVGPGQVQQYLPERGFEATVVLFSPMGVMTDEGLRRESGRDSVIDQVLPEGSVRLDADVLAQVRRDFEQLAEEYDALCGAAHEVRIVHHRLNVLLLRLAGLDAAGQRGPSTYSAASNLVARFDRELERHLSDSHRVADYARWLGCAPRTLHSSCVALRGAGPKTLIERRLVLEAQRLLVHTRWTAERIANELGFAEPANFSRLFRQVAGASPGRFREQQGALGC